MVTLNYIEKINPVVFPEGTTENKRNLSNAEIEILLKKGNVSDFEELMSDTSDFFCENSYYDDSDYEGHYIIRQNYSIETNVE